jgi:3-hydroxyacyl-[acyl-carrier-protein] dehydratase
MSDNTEPNPQPGAADANAAGAMDILEVMRRLPHRYPMLLVDRVLECVPKQSIRALKNVSFNEHFFQGHFPNRPVMPGVLMLEALAQAAGILAFVSAGVYPSEKTQIYFVGLDKVRFRRPVEPGDQIILKANLQRALRGIWKFDTIAEVAGAEAVSAELMVAPGVI